MLLEAKSAHLGARPTAGVAITVASALGLLLHCGGDDPTTSKASSSGSEPSDAAPQTETSRPDVPDASADVTPPPLAPTSPSLLASGDGKDEDPCVLRAADGTFHLFWYSNRDGADRIWARSSVDARSWTDARAITAPGDHVFYPSVAQTPDGHFHLVAWQGSVGDGGKIVGRIAHYGSTDSVSWGSPTFLTDAAALAWSPTIVARDSGELVVTWSSDVTGDKDVYVASSETSGGSWSAPARLTTSAFHDDLPFLAKRSDGGLVLAWERYATSASAGDAPFTHATNDLVYATSSDGKSWSAPIAITNDGTIPDVIPSLFPTADPTGFSVVWASVRGTSKTGDLSMLPLSAAPASASNVTQLTDAAGNDYSARLVLAEPPDLYLVAWVSDRPPSKGLDIWTQLVRIP